MKDKRAALAIGTTIKFEETENEFIIKSIKGRGSNAVCYSAEYEDSQIKGNYHEVIIKEMFPYDEENRIYRDENGVVVCESGAEEYFNFHRESFLHGAKMGIILQRIRPDMVMPGINNYKANGTLYAVIGFSGGKTLAEEYYGDLKSIAECVINILYALKIFHNYGILHLDISPDNIMLMPRDKTESSRSVMLIDYNSSFSLDKIKNNSDKFYTSKKEPYSAPEIMKSDLNSIGFSTDLYSVAAIFAMLIDPDFNFKTPENNFMSIKRNDSASSGSGILENVPKTAAHKAAAIICKGLRSSARLRYSGIDEFLDDLKELTERIDGEGVTLAALWESSAKSFKSNIAGKNNYAYINDNSIPSQVSLTDVIQKQHIQIVGTGGMGKSTALLRIWSDGIKRYNPNSPVSLYFKLGEYDGSIRRRCLDRLNFSSANSTFENATRAFNAILKKRINKNTPSVIFLLDGLNEVPQEKQKKLIEEIKDLASYDGAAIILTSRAADANIDDFTQTELKELELSEIENYLNSKKIMYSDNASMNALLGNPMMLSMYSEVMLSGKSSAEEYTQNSLIDAYIKYLTSKSTEKEISEFAARYILPLLTDKMVRRRRHFIAENELYKIVGAVYSEVCKKSFEKVFPDFRGKSQKIKGEAKNADEWFERCVRDILVKELALLVPGENNQYVFIHQIFRDYFYDKKSISLYRRKIIKGTIIFCMALAVITGAGFLYHYISVPTEIFPSTDIEIKNVNEAIDVLQSATIYFSMSLLDGHSMIDSLKKTPSSNDNLAKPQLEAIIESSLSEFRRLDSSRIAHTVKLLDNLKENTVDTDTYSELCRFSSEFSVRRNELLTGIYNKCLLIGSDSPRMEEICTNYTKWAENKAYEYVLLLKYTINSLPYEYQDKFIGMKDLALPLLKPLRDNSFDINKYESVLSNTYEIDKNLISYFKKEGILK